MCEEKQCFLGEMSYHYRGDSMFAWGGTGFEEEEFALDFVGIPMLQLRNVWRFERKNLLT
jgi:hypothetical protein